MRVIKSMVFAIVLAFLLWIWPEALWFLPIAMVAPPLCDTSCCGPGCTIFSDDFSTDRTGTDYTVVSGSWSVTGGKLTTGSTGAVIVENTAGTTGHGRVSIVGQVSTSGASFRLIGSYVNASNYVFCEVTVNGASSTFKLWKRVSGSDTQLGTTHTFTGTTATDYTLELCWNGTIASASIGGSNAKSGLYAGVGNKAGVGATASGGTVTLDLLSFSKNHSDDATCTACATIDCIACTGIFSGLSSRLQLDVVGLTDGTCGACDTLNGTYVLNYMGVAPCLYFSSACVYAGLASATCGSEAVTWVRVYVENRNPALIPAGPQIIVEFGEQDDNGHVTFSITGGGRESCGAPAPNVSLEASTGAPNRWYFDECAFSGGGTLVGI